MAELSDGELLVLIVPAARVDDVVDFLIGIERLAGFSRSRVAGFSREHSRLSVREAVLGYREQARFEVQADSELLDTVVRDLAGIAGRDRFRYWRLPLTATGTISDPDGSGSS